MERDYFLENVDYLKQDLGKHNISQTLFQRFKELIIDGKLPAGYMMPNENIVSEHLGVGRSTLREAYTALAVFGFIRRSKAGTYVNEIDNIVNIAPFSITVENSDLNDLLEFRYMLEAETASYAAKRATPDWNPANTGTPTAPSSKYTSCERKAVLTGKRSPAK